MYSNNDEDDADLNYFIQFMTVQPLVQPMPSLCVAVSLSLNFSRFFLFVLFILVCLFVCFCSFLDIIFYMGDKY